MFFSGHRVFHGTARQTAEKSNVFLGGFRAAIVLEPHCWQAAPFLECLILGAPLVILLEPLFWRQVALPVEFKTVLLKENVRFLLVPESWMVLLEAMLTWMVSCLKESLKVQTAFLEFFRLSPVQEAFALVPAVSTVAASPGTHVLRVLGGGHSADRGGCSGAGVAACSSGVERLRRQACSSFRDFIGVFDSLSSHHVDRVRSRSVCGDGDTNSCFVTHDARANSWGTLHAARINSGVMLIRSGVRKNSCGGVWGGTKPMSMSTRCQDRCPAAEKLFCSRHQEGCMSRRGQDAMGTPACRFPRLWKSCRGVRTW